ncbi:MAG: transporter [Hyphomicrobiaceae bacterium]|nr:transporter [Hyphomicrobiaceae bacterium]
MTPPPAGVMGAHLMRKGKVMMMYTPMFMHMGGSRIGTRDVTPETIVTTVPNRFDQNPMMPGVQPPTLRIAPETMSMEMHMFSLMYGITDTINVMIMSSYVEKEMRMVTFAGMAGTNRLGTSTGNTEGMGDTTVSLAFKVFEGHGNRLNASLGVSIPTGSTDEVGRMLSPMGMMMQMRSAYGMQLGTGTYDLVPSVTWTGHTGRLGWGAQYKGRIALEDESDEGYRWGNLHEVTAWLSYGLTSGLNGTARIAASTQGTIHGADPRIGGPFQGTYPEFYGGERIEAFLGLDGHIPLGHGTMARIAIEAGVPIYQNLNGPQLERDWSLVLSTGIHF